ncbi:MAG: GyrI-like domain-containing protein [Candidatus Hodarchaeales archaeon]|jgi:predicted transcriptional regulator YdeE/DNA-binding transcriptional ArsR family regulator
MTDQSFESEEAMKAFILETADEISELLKTLQHPRRLEILTLMLKKEKEFGTLMTHTKLPKSALGNHLTELLEKNLIEKLDRGIYRITIDGQEFLSSISSIFLNAKIREQERLESQRKRYQDMIARYTRYRFENGEIMALESKKRSKTEMEVEIQTQSAFTIMGLQERGKNAEFIPAIWERFLKRSDEIKEKIKSNTIYGLSYHKNKSTKEFSYLVGHEIEPGTEVPEGFVTNTIPKLTYVVVKCTSPTLSEAWHFASKWIVQNGYKDNSYSFGEYEVYPESFKDEKTDMMYIYVPIIKNNKNR